MLHYLWMTKSCFIANAKKKRRIQPKFSHMWGAVISVWVCANSALIIVIIRVVGFLLYLLFFLSFIFFVRHCWFEIILRSPCDRIVQLWYPKLKQKTVSYFHLIRDTFQFDIAFFISLRFHLRFVNGSFGAHDQNDNACAQTHMHNANMKFCTHLLNVTRSFCWAWEKCKHENYTKKSERVIQIKQAVTGACFF